MDQLLKLKESIFGYLSPARRRRTVLPTTPEGKLRSMQRPVDPVTEPKDSKHRAVISGRVNKKYLSPSDTKRARGLKSKNANVANLLDEDEEESEDMYEEAEEAEMSGSDIGPEDSSSQLGSPGIEIESSFSTEDEGVEEEHFEESELDAEAKVHRFLDQQAELTRIRASLEDIKGKGWHKDEVALFEKLSMRGLEPLLPSNWFHEFPTFPSNLFSKKFEETFVNARSGEEFRGMLAVHDWC
jgi:hypothetical protein